MNNDDQNVHWASHPGQRVGPHGSQAHRWQAPPMGWPPVIYPKPKPWVIRKWPIALGLGLIALVLLILAAACTSPTPAPNLVTPTMSAGAQGDGESSPTPGVSSPDPNEIAPVNKKDIKLTVKITDKTCYGSGFGCNVSYQVDVSLSELGMADLKARGKDVQVTYDVKGLKNGGQTHTITMHPDGTYDNDGEEFGDTGDTVKLSASVTSVEEQ